MPSRTPPSRPSQAAVPADVAASTHDDAAGARRRLGPLSLFLGGATTAAAIAVAQFLSGDSGQLLGSVPGTGWLSGRSASHATPGDNSERASTGEVIQSLDELTSKFGEPPDATYGRVRIPTIGVDAPLGMRIAADGQLQDPSSPADVVWYDFGGNSGLGGAPGAGQNAVLAGHVDRNGPVPYAGVEYNGPGVFFLLDRVSEGDLVEVTAGNKTWRYSVIWVREVDLDDDWNTLFSADVLGDSITIVTCAGDFNYETHEYPSRLVVRAVRG
jgi:LPXTG-site transpeptidase (sortase) family protein